MFEIKLAGGGKVSVKKSMGRMLTLMGCTELPLRRYDRGNCRLYTLPPLGPRPGLEGELYDWRGSSPVKFQQSTVEDALTDGYVSYVVPHGNDFELTSLGKRVADACRPDWEPEFAEHFAGRGVSWIEGLRAQAAADAFEGFTTKSYQVLKFCDTDDPIRLDGAYLAEAQLLASLGFLWRLPGCKATFHTTQKGCEAFLTAVRSLVFETPAETATDVKQCPTCRYKARVVDEVCINCDHVFA